MNIIRLWSHSIVIIIGWVLLIRQCFKPYFIDPEKVIYSEWIYNDPDRLNRFGRIFTFIVIAFTSWVIVIPTVKDTYYFIKGEYLYKIVETENDYSIHSTSAKYGRVCVLFHDEFIYDPETDKIEYVGKQSETDEITELYLNLVDYKEGEYYLVKYLPNTEYAEIVYYLGNIDLYKIT